MVRLVCEKDDKSRIVLNMLLAAIDYWNGEPDERLTYARSGFDYLRSINSNGPEVSDETFNQARKAFNKATHGLYSMETFNNEVVIKGKG